MFRKLKFGLCILSLIFLINVDVSGQELKTKPLVLNKGPQLFLDDYLIAEHSFLTRTVNNPKKLQKPVLAGGEKNDQVFQPYVTVLRDPQTRRFRMWYNTPSKYYNHLAYIESEDGINWIRPPKIFIYPDSIQRLRPVGASVLDRGVDYKDRSKRYVLASYMKPGFRISTSPDGLNWTLTSKEPVFLHNHDITSLHWDMLRQQYIAILSHNLKGFGNPANPAIDDIRRIPHDSS